MPAAEIVFESLRGIVGSAHVLTGDDMTIRFDGYPQDTPVAALCIVRPGDTAEVSDILRYCDRHGVPVVAQGGRTGLSKGAQAAAHEVALSLERLTAIGPIDADGSTLLVEAGVPLQRVQETARDAGLIYPVDLGARGTATIGGTIATNAGGNSVLRYGMTRDQILGLEVVLADGTILSSLNRMMKNNAGYDLKQLFIGSEGTLGIVTRAVLRLKVAPGPRATALIGVAGFDQGLALLGLLSRAAEGALSSFELSWPEYYEVALASGRHQRPLTGRHAFYVLAEIASAQSQERLETAIAEAWEAGLVEDAVIAASEAQADALWAVRDDVEAMMARYKPLFLFDVSLPQRAMNGYIDELRSRLLCVWPDAVLIVFGHIADGNLHVCIWTGDEADHAAVNDIVYGLLRPLVGSISAEHGIGLEKRHYLDVSRSHEEIAAMRRLKAAFDPRNTLNPGKVLA